MAIPKTLGIETEYGIVHKGTDDPNPIAASSRADQRLSVRRRLPHRQHRSESVHWDFIDETPGNDARGYAPTGAMPPEVETHLVNAVLTNGARYYVDHAHPEMLDPGVRRRPRRRALRPGRRAHRRRARWRRPVNLLPRRRGAGRLQEQQRRQGQQLRLPRELPRGPVDARSAGSSTTPPPTSSPARSTPAPARSARRRPGMRIDDVDYQLTQRADFFEEEVGLETTLKRPIINTRDEPHADARKYRRLHVIVGDANLIAGGDLPEGRHHRARARHDRGRRVHAATSRFARPCPPCARSPTTCRSAQPLELDDGTHHHRARGAVGAPRPVEEVRRGQRHRQRRRRRRARRAAADGNTSSPASRTTRCRCRPNSTGWRSTGSSTATGSATTLAWSDARLAGDGHPVPRHAAREVSGVASRPARRIVDDAEALLAATEPPHDTRAYFRGRCLQRVPRRRRRRQLGLPGVRRRRPTPLRRVPMMEPLRGTEAHVGTLFDECDSAADLLRRLGN